MPKQTTYDTNVPSQQQLASTPVNGPDDQSPAIAASMEEIVIDNDNATPNVDDAK